MAKGIMYDGSTPRGMHLRAVVTQSGDVVAKNYDSRKLIEESKEGVFSDVGITVRVDGQTDILTPAQQASLKHVAGEMSGRLLARIGVETDFGFKPGMVVEATRDREDDGHVGYVEKQADGGLYLRCFDQDMRLKRVFVPMSVYQVEEVPDRFGLDGLFVHQTLKGNCHVGVALSKHTLSVEACREVWGWMVTAEAGMYNKGDAEMLLCRINEQEFIRREASDAKSGFRFAAAALVEDQDLLVSFLRHEWWKGGDVSPIIEKIRDEESIQKAILGWLDGRVCVPGPGWIDTIVIPEAAWKRITRQDLAIGLLQHPRFPYDRSCMLDLVKDAEGLKTVVLTSEVMRHEAACRLDQGSLKELVLGCLKSGNISDDLLSFLLDDLERIEDRSWVESFCLECDPSVPSERQFLTRAINLLDFEGALRAVEKHPLIWSSYNSGKLPRHRYYEWTVKEGRPAVYLYKFFAGDRLLAEMAERCTDSAVVWHLAYKNSHPEEIANVARVRYQQMEKERKAKADPAK